MIEIKSLIEIMNLSFRRGKQICLESGKFLAKQLARDRNLSRVERANMARRRTRGPVFLHTDGLKIFSISQPLSFVSRILYIK